MIVAMVDISSWWYLFLRGCAGILALTGVMIYVIYVFRINRDYERAKYIRRKDNDSSLGTPTRNSGKSPSTVAKATSL